MEAGACFWRGKAAGSVASLAGVEPIAPRRFALHCSIDEESREHLRELQELLSHQFGPGEVGSVIGLALRSLLREVRKRKCGAADRPQANPRPTHSARHIPAGVRRAVQKRDGGQCTFVSEEGRRCAARASLEYDHIVEVARGGTATVGNIRLRCRTHNQFTAEQALGAEFMRRKREESRIAVTRVAAARELIPALERLGYRAKEARLAAEHSASEPEAPVEVRLRRALHYLRPATVKGVSALTSATLDPSMNSATH